MAEKQSARPPTRNWVLSRIKIYERQYEAMKGSHKEVKSQEQKRSKAF